MKTMKQVALFCLLVAGMITGCEKDTNIAGGPSAIDVPIESPGWKMELFMENGRDQSMIFKKYIFRFLNTEVVTATGGKDSYHGRWTTKYNDKGITFVIVFGQLPFRSMNADWEVIRMDTKTIQLKRRSADDGGDGWDYLKFTEM